MTAGADGRQVLMHSGAAFLNLSLLTAFGVTVPPPPSLSCPPSVSTAAIAPRRPVRVGAGSVVVTGAGSRQVLKERPSALAFLSFAITLLGLLVYHLQGEPRRRMTAPAAGEGATLLEAQDGVSSGCRNSEGGE